MKRPFSSPPCGTEEMGASGNPLVLPACWAADYGAPAMPVATRDGVRTVSAAGRIGISRFCTARPTAASGFGWT